MYRVKAHIIIASILCALLLGCRSSEEKEDRAIYDKVFGRFNDLNLNRAEEDVRHYMDSLHRPGPDDPAGYTLAWYRCKSEVAYFYGHKLDTNAFYVDSQLQFIEQRHLEKRFAPQYLIVLTAKADIAFFANDMASAFEYYSRSKILAQDLKDTCNAANQAYHLGMVCYRQERYDEAVARFKESLTATGACGYNEFSLYRNTELLGNIGLSYARSKIYDSAMTYYRRSVDFVEVNSKGIKTILIHNYAALAAGVAYGNMAAVYMEQGRYDSAEHLLYKNIAINDREGFDPKDAMSSYMRLAELYHTLHSTVQMAAMLDSVEKRLRSFPDKPIELRWLRLMYERYRPSTGSAEAWQYVALYQQLKDTLDAENNALKQTDYSQLLKTKDAQYQITLLQKDNKLSRIYLLVAIGSVVIILAIIVLIYNNYRKSKRNVAMLTTMNDQVNEQKQKLEEAMELLRQSNNDKDRILHVVAHDLRNPVGAVISLIDLMRDDSMPAEQQELLDMMREASASALTLISELLRHGSDHTSTEQKEIADLGYLARKATQLLKHKADEKQQALQLALPGSPLHVLAHPEQLVRVFSNLISNAVKFSREGAAIHIAVTHDKAKALISITDSGIGIPEEDKPFVFDLFTSARQKGTAGEHSFGLGLSICKQIIEIEGGKIWFESTTGIGSTFYIELPLVSV